MVDKITKAKGRIYEAVVLDRQLYVVQARAGTYANAFLIAMKRDGRNSILCTFRFSHRKWKKMRVPSNVVLENNIINNVARWLYPHGSIRINYQEALKLIEHYGKHL